MTLRSAAFMALLLLPSASLGAAPCDGFHRCRCGVTAARRAGLPLDYHGCNLKMAREWKRCFKPTAPFPGAVVYQRGGGPSGHVSTIVAGSGCRVTVADDAGTYERNICARGAVIVDPRS